MTKTKKWMLPLLLSGALLAGGVGAALTGSAAGDVQTPAAGSPAALWTLASGVTAESNVSVPDYMLYGKETNTSYVTTEYTQSSADLGLADWQKNGVKFTASSANRWVEYSNVVDISSYQKNDILLAFTPLATARGNADFNEFNVKLTDAEDEDNYLLIKIKPSQWYPATFTAETAELEPCGYQYGDYRPGYSEATWAFSDKYHVGFDGTTNDAVYAPEGQGFDKMEARHRSIILHYDFEDKAVWVTGQEGSQFCIMDLDWSESVGYGKEWKGFSSGKVKLSFCSKQHRSGSPSYMVLNAFNTPMNGAQTTDTQEPVLLFGEEVSSDTAPSALVGRTYRLPTVACLDTVDGEIACDIRLTDPDGEEVTVTDNAFVPEKTGFYTLTYTASDKAGNPVEKTLRFTAQKNVPAVTIEAQPDKTDVEVGAQVRVPKADITAKDGAYIVETDVEVLRAGTSERVALENDVFIPLFAGEYRVVYSATDWLGFTHTHTVCYAASNPQNRVTTHGKLQQLRRLFDGVAVRLPALNAYDYLGTAGVGIAQEATVRLSGNGQSETLPAGSVFTPDYGKFGQKLTVEYRVGDVMITSYQVDIMEMPDTDAADYADKNDGTYQLDDYFIFDEDVQVEYNSASDESEFYRISAKKGETADKGFKFVNPLQADGFNVSFSVPDMMKNFTALKLTLRDAFDASIGFDLRLEDILTSTDEGFKDTYTFVTLNGGQKYTMYGTYNYYVYHNKLNDAGEEVKDDDGNPIKEFDSKVTSSLTLTYRDGSIFDINGDEVCKITENIDGSAWKGFPSGMVYFDMTFEGVGTLDVPDHQTAEYGTNAAIALSSLCGQTFYVTYRQDQLANFFDISNPIILANGSVPTEVYLGQTISVPQVVAYDALTPYVEVLVTVQTPNNSTIYSSEPLQEGMSFVVDTYGLYYIRYTATDATGNSATLTYTVGASDTTAPTVALSSYEDLQGSVGKNVTIPAAVVQDNRDDSPRLFIFVIGPDAAITPLGEVTAENAITGFTPSAAGEHTLLYYAIDADYNATVVTVRVTVK